MTNRYLIVIEKTKINYSAYSPDLPGCIATGKIIKEVKSNIHNAIQMHIDGLKEDGLPIPKCNTKADFISVG